MDYADDVRISERGIKEMSEAYRKIRNTFRYLLGNLEDYARFDPASRRSRDSLHEIDRWALGQLNQVIRDVRGGVRASSSSTGSTSGSTSSVSVELSSFYLDVLKDRLYAEAPDGPDRRAAQFVLARAARRPDPAPRPDHPAHGRGVVGLTSPPARTSRRAST